MNNIEGYLQVQAQLIEQVIVYRMNLHYYSFDSQERVDSNWSSQA